MARKTKKAPQIPVVEADARAKAFFAALDREEKEAEEVGAVLRPNGFEFHHSGGGCTAWVLTEEHNYETGPARLVQIWVTDGDAKAPARLSEECDVSVMTTDSCECTLSLHFKSVREFLSHAALFRQRDVVPPPTTKGAK